jgi:hypothetical protein
MFPKPKVPNFPKKKIQLGWVPHTYKHHWIGDFMNITIEQPNENGHLTRK